MQDTIARFVLERNLWSNFSTPEHSLSLVCFRSEQVGNGIGRLFCLSYQGYVHFFPLGLVHDLTVQKKWKKNIGAISAVVSTAVLRP